MVSLICRRSDIHGQPLTYGFKLGVPFADETRAFLFSTNTQSGWVGGRFIELHLPYRLSVEFSTTLLRTSRENTTMSFPLGATQNPYLVFTTDKVTWDFPLLLKYRFTEGKFRPFIGAGAAWSHWRSDFER